MTLSGYIAALRGKRIGVLGIGVSNRPLIRELLAGGCDVTACDKSHREQLGDTAAYLEGMGAKLRLGPNYLQDLDFDVIFRTPGLHPYTPELIEAQERGCILTSEMEAFFTVCPCRTVAITGSDGKTTTSTIIAELLNAQGYTVHLGGNSGKPLLKETPGMKAEDVAVLELSSFQRHSMKCAPDIAVVTNLSPNHLDVHPDFEDYLFARALYIKDRSRTACWFEPGQRTLPGVCIKRSLPRALVQPERIRTGRRFHARRRHIPLAGVSGGYDHARRQHPAAGRA